MATLHKITMSKLPTVNGNIEGSAITLKVKGSRPEKLLTYNRFNIFVCTVDVEQATGLKSKLNGHVVFSEMIVYLKLRYRGQAYHKLKTSQILNKANISRIKP